MPRAHAYAIQVAGCTTLYGTHSAGPSLTYTLNASTPSYGYERAISTDSQMLFDRSFAGNAAGVVTVSDVTVTLTSRRLHGRDTSTDAGRVFGRETFDGMQWYAALTESVVRDADTPTFDVVDPGVSVPSIVHVGREAMEVTYSNPTVTVVKRAVLGTPRLDHRLDTERGDTPYMTPDPLVWRGARVNIWSAPVRSDGSLGTWNVRFRGDIAEVTDRASTIELRIVSVLDRLSQPLATDSRVLRLADEHTWADDVGTTTVLYTWAVVGELYRGSIAADAAIGDADIELSALGDGSAGVTAHQAVAAWNSGGATFHLPQGHPRRVPVIQYFRLYEYDVTGYTAPNIDITPNVVGRTIESTVLGDPASYLTNGPVAESTVLQLVDTSGGPVTARGADYLRAQFADTTKFGIGDRDWPISGVTRRTGSFARVAYSESRGRQVWRTTAKVRPSRQFYVGLTNRWAARDIAERFGIADRLEANAWTTGAQQGLDDVVGGRPGDYPTPLIDPLVWSWYGPDETAGMREALNGQRFGARRIESIPQGRAVSLSAVGESVDVDAAPIAPRWYQAGETYITLDGPTGVGASGRVVLEVRREGDDAVIGKCIAIAEAQLASGAYRVELEVPASPNDDYALPTIVEGVPGAQGRFTLTPAFVVENTDAGLGDAAIRLITSGGGDGINSTFDTAPFGGQLLDGSGTLGDGDMGADVDAASILALPSIAGADISIVGRPSSDGRDGDSVISLLRPHLEVTGYVLDLVVDPSPADPFDGCLVAARPVRRPSPQEISVTIPHREIISIERIPAPILNAFAFGANYGEDGKPGIVGRISFSASIGTFGERQAEKLEIIGANFPTPGALVTTLRPYMTRLSERAFPPPRYRLDVATAYLRDSGIAYGSGVYVTNPRAPLPDGTIGLSLAACRVVALTLDELSAQSSITVDYYGTVARGRAPCCAVIDYIDASTVKVATNFFADVRDPVTGDAVTDMDLLLNPTYGGAGVGAKIIIRQRGDVDTTRRMQVAAYDTSTGQIQVEDDPAEAVYGDAHGIADPGAEQSPEDYIAVIEPREVATSDAGMLAYFHHDRDILA